MMTVQKQKYYFRGRKHMPHGVTAVSRLWGIKAANFARAAELAAKLQRKQGYDSLEHVEGAERPATML